MKQRQRKECAAFLRSLRSQQMCLDNMWNAPVYFNFKYHLHISSYIYIHWFSFSINDFISKDFCSNKMRI